MISNSGVYVNFVSLDQKNAYPLQKYGKVNLRNNTAEVVFFVTEYFPSGRYSVAYLNMKDAALNIGTQYFSRSSHHERPVVVKIRTSNPDTRKPTLDLNRISVSARPINPKNPDGQTEVTITYYAKDDKSGVGPVSYWLQDPVGKTYHAYHYHKNTHSLYFMGNPQEYKEYVIRHMLPKGSAPGTWGLREITLGDKGGNSISHSFARVLHFSVDDE